jgi:hypothetical protein
MKNERGISLVELLVIMSIIAIISAFGYPYFNKTKYVIKSDALKLFNINHLAKSEAVKRNAVLYIGINDKQIDFYVDNELIKSNYLDHFRIYTDSVTGGELGGAEVPTLTPFEIIEQCNGNMVDCQAYIDWRLSFEPIEYDYIYSFNQLGVTQKEILLKLIIEYKTVDTLFISFIGTIRSVIYR